MFQSSNSSWRMNLEGSKSSMSMSTSMNFFSYEVFTLQFFQVFFYINPIHVTSYPRPYLSSSCFSYPKFNFAQLESNSIYYSDSYSYIHQLLLPAIFSTTHESKPRHTPHLPTSTHTACKSPFSYKIKWPFLKSYIHTGLWVFLYPENYLVYKKCIRRNINQLKIKGLTLTKWGERERNNQGFVTKDRTRGEDFSVNKDQTKKNQKKDMNGSSGKGKSIASALGNEDERVSVNYDWRRD